MNTLHRAQSHQKRRMWCDPMASIHVLAANSEQPKANADAIMVTLRLAFEKLKTGIAVIEDFDRLAAAINVGLIRAELIDPLAEETMVKGVAALVHCGEIHQRHGKFGFAGPELTDMNDAVNLYEDILRLSTPKQMLVALDTAARRMLEQSRRAVA